MDGIGKEIQANRAILDAVIQDQVQWAQNMPTVFDVKKDNAVADSFLGCKILYTWTAVGWIEGELVKRNVDLRIKIGCEIDNFFDFYKHHDDTS